jgi:hypothetical protein
VDDRIARLESTVEQLRSAVDSLQRRIAVLEAPGAPLPDGPADAVATGRPQARPTLFQGGLSDRNPYDPIVVLTLVGRLFLVLAGGFFLRAMTEAGLLRPAVGVAMAFAYALIWLFMCDRAGRRKQVSNAVFHALAAAMVAFPLLVEATTRFEVLGGAGAALAITLLSAAFVFVAWRQRLQAIGWVTVLAALPTSLVLMAKTGMFAPFALYLIALGVASLWLAYSRGWIALSWPGALGADLAVLGVTLRALSPQHQDLAGAALLLQWLLLGAYVASIAVNTLVRHRRVTVLEVVQTVVALLISFGGTLLMTRATGSLPAAIGVASLVFGLACYGVAYAFVETREGLERNAYFYTTLALVLVLAGCALVLHEPWLGLAFAVLGVLAAARWNRVGRLNMLLHAATYVVAAAIASGALGYGAWALAAAPEGPWPLPRVTTVLVLAATALTIVLAAARPRPEGGVPADGARVVMLLVLLWVASASVIGLLAPLIAGLPDRSVNLGALATLRTCVLAVAALLIAWVARHARFREWAWLVYPLLVVVGLKMVVQDFQHSRPSTLFIALALFGAALIIAPRLRRGSAKAGIDRDPTAQNT